MDTEPIPTDVAALLRSQLEVTGRSAESAPALSGKEAPVSGRGRGRAAAKPAAKKPAAKKPAAKKPAAKVALVKKAAARPKSKR
jgi:DNA topoisomerase-1